MGQSPLRNVPACLPFLTARCYRAGEEAQAPGRRAEGIVVVVASGREGKSQSRMKPIVFCDFDGTITQIDVTDLILNELAHPSWREVEEEWIRGSIGSRECLERQMALVKTSEPQLKALIDSVPLDPHFAAFCHFLEKRRVPLYVVSDGFDYVIRRLLKRAGVNGQFRNG